MKRFRSWARVGYITPPGGARGGCGEADAGPGPPSQHRGAGACQFLAAQLAFSFAPKGAIPPARMRCVRRWPGAGKGSERKGTWTQLDPAEFEKLEKSL